MKKNIICLLILLVLVIIPGCSSASNQAGQPSDGTTTQASNVQAVMQQYYAFNEKYKAANMENMKIDLMNPDQNQQYAATVNSLLTEAESIQAQMNAEIAKTQDIRIQAQIKPFMSIIQARIVTLKTNQVTLESYGT